MRNWHIIQDFIADMIAINMHLMLLVAAAFVVVAC
jgi:hypothetical protein